MNHKIKSLVYNAIPKTLLLRLLQIYSTIKTLKARKVFNQTDETLDWLDANILEHLQNSYPFRPKTSYDADAIKQRGEEWGKRILSLIKPDEQLINNVLKLGAGYGMVSNFLQKRWIN